MFSYPLTVDIVDGQGKVLDSSRLRHSSIRVRPDQDKRALVFGVEGDGKESVVFQSPPGVDTTNMTKQDILDIVEPIARLKDGQTYVHPMGEMSMRFAHYDPRPTRERR